MAHAKHDHSAFNVLPDHRIHGRQFLYAIELCNGIVKIGRTWNPQARMKALACHHSRTDGKRIVRFVAHQTQLNSARNERELIQRLNRIAKPVAGAREYFAECQFGRVATLVRQIAGREVVAYIPIRSTDTKAA